MGKDSLRITELRNHLLVCDPSEDLHNGMERAFGKNLKTVEKTANISTDEEYEKFLLWEIGETVKFIHEIKN